MKNTPRKPERAFTKQSSHFVITSVFMTKVFPYLSPNAKAVLIFIMFKTQGFNKEQDKIPYSQIRKGTGIASNATISKALHELMGEEPFLDWSGKIAGWYPIEGAPQLIFCLKGKWLENSKREANSYCLNLDFTI